MIENYEDFVQRGIEAVSRPESTGGGLIRRCGDGHRCFLYEGLGTRFFPMNG